MVAENVLSLDQRFWLRIATRSDSAASREDKDKLASLANAVMAIGAWGYLICARIDSFKCALRSMHLFKVSIGSSSCSPPPLSFSLNLHLSQSLSLSVDAMVRSAESQIVDSAEVLQEILKAAANERGEWPLPLPKAQVAAMRTAMDARAAHVNESLLATVYAYLKKASDDKMDGLVALLQKFLQVRLCIELLCI